MAEKLEVVYDMETQDPDDFLCLLFLASHPQVRLKAVTLNPGSREQVGLVRWALGVLGLTGSVAVGAGDITRSSAGSVSPWHARAFGFRRLPESADAEEAWRVLVRECDERTILFTGGALTNVARAIAERADGFVAKCWVGQGGFAGDNVVPPECRLPKFAGKTHQSTFNFQADNPAALAALSHRGFGEVRLVSKNVCHAESNAFGRAQLARLLQVLRGRGVPDSAFFAPEELLRSGGGTDTARHNAGLSLMAIGLRNYLEKHTSGKLLHDPLAAASILDPRVISAWREVVLELRNNSVWGSKPAEGSGTHISVQHDPERFWAVFLGEDAAAGGAGRSDGSGDESGGELGEAPSVESFFRRDRRWRKSRPAACALERSVSERFGPGASRYEEAALLDWQRTGEAAAAAAREKRWTAARQGFERCSELRPDWPKTQQLLAVARAKEAAALPVEEEAVPAAVPLERAAVPAEKEAAHGDAWPCDWEGRELPRFAAPGRPPRNEGLDALERLALNPDAKPDRVLMSTAHCVVIYDVYPKARMHVLVVPRVPLPSPQDLRTEHAPLLRHMASLAAWLAPRLRRAGPGRNGGALASALGAPLRCGFHAVPSMRQLHLHLISLDFDSPELKRPRHFNIFNSGYLVPPGRWADDLEARGCVVVDHTAEMATAKGQMRCPLSGRTFDTMEALRAYLQSSAYRSLVEAIEDDLVFIGGERPLNGLATNALSQEGASTNLGCTGE